MSTKADGTATALYARISEDRDSDALGVERQVVECRSLATARGWKIYETYLDNDRSAYSGRTRPEWERMLGDLRDGRCSSVIAWANDRLYRRTRDQLDLLEAVAASGGTVATVKDGDIDPTSAEGRMRATILSSVAEFESSRKAERVTAAAAQRAALGRPHGRPSFGWRWVRDDRGEPIPGRWELDPEPAALLREAAARVLGGESCGSICRDWNAKGVPTARKAQVWNFKALRKLLHRPANAALREYRGEVVGAGDWPAILDQETWEAVVVALRSHTAPQRKPRKYLLSGVLVCGIDGERMTGHVARNRGYACVKCGQRIAADRIDELVTAQVLDALDTPRLAERISAAQHDQQEGHALHDLAAADARLNDLAELFGEGTIDLEEYRVARKVAAERRAEAERRLSDRRGTRTLAEIATAPGGIRELWEAASLGWRRQLLDAVLEGIEVGPSTRPGWQPDRVTFAWRS